MKDAMQTRQTLWIVVLVESGIPVLVEAYRFPQVAMEREQELRGELNPDDDEVAVFEVEIEE